MFLKLTISVGHCQILGVKAEVIVSVKKKMFIALLFFTKDLVLAKGQVWDS